MANSNDFQGTPQPRNPAQSSAGDEVSGNPVPPAAPLEEAEEWPIDAPLPEGFEQGSPPQRESAGPKPSLRISPMMSGSGASSFESNRRATPPVSLNPPPAVAAPAPVPVSRSGNPTGHRAGDPRPGEDFFETDEPLPAPSPRKTVIPASRDSVGEDESTSARVNESEEPTEFGSQAPDPLSPVSPAAGLKPVTKAEKLSIAALLLVVLGILGIFAGALHAGRPLSSDSEASPFPKVPMKGAVATLAKVETDWRPRRKSDRVSMMDIALPEVDRHQPDILPEVKFTLDPAASKTGYLRFIFLDPDGEISGDVLVMKVVQGKLESNGGGGEVLSATEGSIYCSLGFLDKPSYVAYAMSDSRRWTVEVSESADYNAGEKGWSRLGLFEIRDQQ